MHLNDLVAAVPVLERPVMLLEDGRGSGGRARLAWGARNRFRLPWDAAAFGRMDWLARVRAPRAYGVLAYELGLPPRALRRNPAIEQPLADFFEPRHEIVLDVDSGRLLHGDGAALPVDHQRSPGARPVAPAALIDRSFTPQGFQSAIVAIKEYIAAGDVYQVNLAVAERFRIAEDPWHLYRRLRSINPSPWMGYADFGDWQMVSGSPELLVEAERQGDSEGDPSARPPGRPSASYLLRTRPIAGTRKKTTDPALNAAMRSELQLDEKEQAEHRMLLDLARNDLGRVARFGSVRVSEREVVEEYSHVFHLVSEVQALADAGRTPWEILAATFPGGTITGAPKIRAMEVIAELEPVARGVYTGGMGWIGDDGLQFNILIRSAVIRDGQGVSHAGAGIVWDSIAEREWREALRKGAAMRSALGIAD